MYSALKTFYSSIKNQYNQCQMSDTFELHHYIHLVINIVVGLVVSYLFEMCFLLSIQDNANIANLTTSRFNYFYSSSLVA